MRLPPASHRWKSPRALSTARERALAFARSEVARQRAAASAGASGQVMADAHSGLAHLGHFEGLLAGAMARLPEGFRALEVGAGMGWIAAMVAARGAGSVLATEVLWAGDRPTHLGAIHSLYRIAERDEALRRAVHFDRGPEGHLTGVCFPTALHFARASADALPVAEGSLDLHWSINCLEHLPDVANSFAEAARALRPGGLCLAATDPLYYSPMGHHLADVFPLPWGHLLWEPEELAEVVVREAGAGREWAPGVPLSAEPLAHIVREELNALTPEALRAAVRGGPWRVEGWLEHEHTGALRLAAQIGLWDAVRGLTADAVALRGVKLFLVRREEGATSARWHAALRLPWVLRRWKRRLLRG